MPSNRKATDKDARSGEPPRKTSGNASGPAAGRARSTPAAKPGRKPAPEEPRLSRHRRPPSLPVADWQLALRQQFGREQRFALRNLGSEPVFSEFAVDNPDSRASYRVRIRGLAPGINSCTCPDYATNHLGTCKHIEFTLARLAARRGGKAALRRGFVPRHTELRLDHAGPRRVRLWPGTDCPAALLASARTLFDADQGWVLRPGAQDHLPGFVRQAGEAGHGLRCDEAVWQFIAQGRDAEHRDRLLRQAYPAGASDKGLARLLKVRLYRYQAEGALFAARAGRSLIGDEMGLGKTVQAIAAAELMARHLGVRRVLVVCPTSLKHQWKAEFARFTGRTAQVIQGLRPARELQYAASGDPAAESPEAVSLGVKITHYETLARDRDLIERWAPDLVIADEAQRIKNWNTLAARALKRIRSPYATVLTGTPLENRLEELLSIVQFVDQHRLGPTWRVLDEHQQRDEAGRVVGYRALDRIQQTLAPILLRRRKAEVLQQLPERVDQRIFVPLTPEQRLHHDENGLVVSQIVGRWRKTGFLSDADQRRLQCALQNMRMACNSTFLLDHRSDHGLKVDELMTLLDELFQQPDAKAVVFSQWLLTHELIQRRLRERGWDHVLFSGSVPGEQRGDLVQRFHEDPGCRLFLSTDAGGVGLNLQHAAAVVVNMDMPWNPAVLEQRIGRVHRMGQRRGVQVINFIGQGSIEEGMLSLLAFKAKLAAGVLDGGSSEVFLSGTPLARFMKSVEQVAGAMGEPETAEPAPAPPPSPAGGPDAAAMADDDDAQDAAEPPAPVHRSADAEAAADAGSTDRAGTPEQRDARAGASSSGAGDGPAATTAGRHDSPAGGSDTAPTGGGGPAVGDPWPALLQAGAAWLQSLARAGAGAGQGGAGSPRIETDPATGQPSLRLPLPEPAVLQQLAQALQPWLR